MALHPPDSRPARWETPRTSLDAGPFDPCLGRSPVPSAGRRRHRDRTSLCSSGNANAAQGKPCTVLDRGREPVSGSRGRASGCGSCDHFPTPRHLASGHVRPGRAIESVRKLPRCGQDTFSIGCIEIVMRRRRRTLRQRLDDRTPGWPQRASSRIRPATSQATSAGPAPAPFNWTLFTRSALECIFWGCKSDFGIIPSQQAATAPRNRKKSGRHGEATRKVSMPSMHGRNDQKTTMSTAGS